MTRGAYDVLVRITVQAKDHDDAVRKVIKWMPDVNMQAFTAKDVYEATQDGTLTQTRAMINEALKAGRGQRGPSDPIDSWAVLTESKVIHVDADAQRDRVTWQAVEES